MHRLRSSSPLQIQIYSSSLDGTIILWDLDDGTKIKSWNAISEPIESLAVIRSMAFITCQWREAQAGRALAIDLSTDTILENRIKLSTPNQLVTSAHGNLIATHDRHTILIWSTSSFGSSSPLAVHHTKAITCVSISPDGSRLAAGDVTGRIVVWHDVASAVTSKQESISNRHKKRDAMFNDPRTIDGDDNTNNDDDNLLLDFDEPPSATVHWHAHAVGCLSFSIDGIFLLSGGKESVLVIWDVISGRRVYLPRLGGHLIGLCPCPGDPAKHAVRQADNTLRIVNTATMSVECSIHGVRPLPHNITRHITRYDGNKSTTPINKRGNNTALHSAKRCLVPPPLTLQPSTGHVVIPGSNVVLQFYDILKDIQADKLPLSSRNIISLTETDKASMSGVYGPPPEPAAELFAFNNDGSVLFTVESRPDPGGGESIQYELKFWDKLENSKYGMPYRVNTVVDQPHRYDGCD